MAWLDDRIWCHPKVMNVPREARWEYAAAICYSSGFGTSGHLSAGQLAIIECAAKDRDLLVKVGLWDDAGDGGIRIHDWDEHNAKRDKRRADDRERKRRSRAKDTDVSAGQVADKTPDGDADNHADGSALTVVKEVTGEELLDTTAAEIQKTSSPSLNSQHANGNGPEPAAAEEPATESTIRAACTRFGADPNIAEPYARQLTAGQLQAIAAKMEMKIRRGAIESVPGQFVDLLQRQIKANQLAARPIVQTPTLEQGLLDDAVGYALGRHPWEVAEELLGKKMNRLGVTPGSQAVILDNLRTAYDNASAA